MDIQTNLNFVLSSQKNRSLLSLTANKAALITENICILVFNVNI